VQTAEGGAEGVAAHRETVYSNKKCIKMSSIDSKMYNFDFYCAHTSAISSLSVTLDSRINVHTAMN
jgi:hypothetical protein